MSDGGWCALPPGEWAPGGVDDLGEWLNQWSVRADECQSRVSGCSG